MYAAVRARDEQLLVSTIKETLKYLSCKPWKMVAYRLENKAKYLQLKLQKKDK